MNEIMQQLQAPFKPCEIEWRVGATNQQKDKGLALAYVTNRAIQDRLDNLFGPFGWRNEYREWKKDSQLCGISIKAEDGEWITKWDGASDSNMEATKGGLSDAMKRAAYQWGIGRYLYKLPAVWMPIKKQGGSYVLAQTPKLPEWALPEGVADEGGQVVGDFDETFTEEDGKWIDEQEPEPVKTGKGFITQKQAGRLFAKAGYEKGNDVAIERSKKIVQEILDELGIKSTGEIKKEEYDEICEQAEVKLAEYAVEV